MCTGEDRKVARETAQEFASEKEVSTDHGFF
jgi:hypothetical protein